MKTRILSNVIKASSSNTRIGRRVKVSSIGTQSQIAVRAAAIHDFPKGEFIARLDYTHES
jgi:hypothetical protein